MPKQIKYYSIAEFKSVEKVSDKQYELWKWREKYIGFHGELFIFESIKKFPGKRYIHFTDQHNYITTGYGEYSVDGNTITLTTHNSIYKFIILEVRTNAQKTADKR